MNTYQIVAKHYADLFKTKTALWQVRLWYHGTTNKADEALLLPVRRRIENTIAPWDCVIRLAMTWTHAQIKSKKLVFEEGFNYTKLDKYIYWLLWSSDFKTACPMKIKGETVYLPTFWTWAVEHRHDYTTHGNADKTIKNILKKLGDDL